MKVLVDKHHKVEILLIAEGTYPYVRGGVASWIHELIGGLPEFKFGLIFLGGRKEDYGDIKYELPENLVYLGVAYLFEDRKKPSPRYISKKKKAFDIIEKIHWDFKRGSERIVDEVLNPNFFINTIKYEDFLYHKQSWEHIVSMYTRYAPEEPFVDYFWNIRNLHAPLWIVSEIASNVCDFGLVHSPSTGYGGLLASMLKTSRKKPFILTEHGIYTRERKIDLFNADWLADTRSFINKRLGELSHNRTIWINFFFHIGKAIYSKADLIISLFEDARKIQISYGAEPEKCQVLPNGVEIKVYEEALNKRPEFVPKVIGLIGRVVSIKDIKTFIKAMKILIEKVPDAQGWIVGPTDEEPNYYEECLELVRALGLEKNVIFLGFRKVSDILPSIGVLTLTSISEGMPLVVLEGFAAGVPCVSTDVGSCRQLIYGGLNEEDIALGKAGEVTPIADVDALAESYAKLLTDQKLWKGYQKTALERVKKFYSMEMFLENYRKIYKRFLYGRNLS